MLYCGFSVVYSFLCLSATQVELAHGGSRGPPPSDRRGGYGGGSSRGGRSGGGGRFGVSRHSEFRGESYF